MSLLNSSISACARKVGYTSLRMAEEELRKMKASKLRRPYKCPACGCWHTTLNKFVKLRARHLVKMEEELFPSP